MSSSSISIAATFTAEPLTRALEMWLRMIDQPARIQFAPFNQVIQSLVEPRGRLVRDEDGLNVLLIRLSDWIIEPGAPELEHKLQYALQEFSEAVTSFSRRYSSRMLIVFCPSDVPAHTNQYFAFQDAESNFAKSLAQVPGIKVLSSSMHHATYPCDSKFDPISNRTGHVPFTSNYYAILGTIIARHWYGLKKRPTKVIVLDCDNTLWSGVCGELGPQGVLVEPEQQLFQSRLLEFRNQGYLLALCSKNAEQDVWNVFDQNPAMILRREHISAAEINWKDKSSGLQQIANRLGLGLDSLLFLDDNPIEIAEVRTNAPSVIALQLPRTSELPCFIEHLWPLDLSAVTSDDQLRAASYQQESDRLAERGRHLSMRSFIENLNLGIKFLAIDESKMARAAQLIERTNQFNLTLKRRSVGELRQFLAHVGTSAFLVEVSDKYGDYGIVGIGVCQDVGDELQVDTLALSCRALGRGVEYHLLKFIGGLASQRHLSRVAVSFVTGDRNEPARNFLSIACTHIPNASENQQHFQFATDQLLQIDPLNLIDAESKGTIPPNATSSSGSSQVGATGRSELINEIATELNSVNKIIARMEQTARPRPELKDPFVPATSELERRIADICEKILGLKQIGIEDPLAPLGANSLQLVQIHSQLFHQLNSDLAITELYTLPTISAIAQRLSGKKIELPAQPVPTKSGQTRLSPDQLRPDDIAVIGMSGRFPGADSVAELWQNLINQVNSIASLTDEQLNLPPDSPLRSNPNLVRKSSAIRDAEYFDAKFFGIFPKEARVMDPQHRLMLECCWTALEDAGYCPDRIEPSVGVFAGCYMDTYILASLQSNPEMLWSLANSFHGGDLHTELGNDKDYLATRISYLLNLRGPAMTIQTACSTSLVAIIQACQALQNGLCDMALAGGATFKFPQHRGYLYTEGGMVSPDGICRPFDADARGTVFGEGVGVVVLKRLEQAIEDGDEIYSVIRGWGINNDGRSKMAYTAPSINGQSAAIEMAHRKAGCSAETISYVEAHGTGTSLGDPIEVDSLTKAFRKSTDKKQFCGIGSVKSNIGHLDVAAGVTGLIKICLAMRMQMIPPSINFIKPNPNIDFDNSPFYVVTQPQPWPAIEGQPRRAGLSSFGVGGTNAHLVVQEPPSCKATTESAEQLLILSARSAEALDKMTQELGQHLGCLSPSAPTVSLEPSKQPKCTPSLADVAFTLQTGRKEFVHKRVLVAKDISEASQLLLNHASHTSAVYTQNQARRRSQLDFVFPGQGSQHLKMALGLYQHDLIFRDYFDQCVEILKPLLGFDLRERIFAEESESSAAAINQTAIAQPAIFSVSYCLAKRLEHLGVRPQRMVGHSVGEFVAACLAGVFSLEEALRLISFRSSHMQALPSGTMVAVRIKEAQLLPRLAGTAVEIAAINSPDLCVITGPDEAVVELQSRLESEDIVCRPLHTSHAFHSQMMDPVVAPFADQFAKIVLKVNEIPIISSVSGKLLTPQQAIDPLYWSRHLRETVRFADAVAELLKTSEHGVVEIGPGQALSTLIRQHPECNADRTVLSIQPHAKLARSSFRHWLLTLGRLWQSGVAVEWHGLYDKSNPRRRVHLPTYPFERQRYWFDDAPSIAPTVTRKPSEPVLEKSDDDETPLFEEPEIGQARSVEPAPGLLMTQPLNLENGHPVCAASNIAEQVIRQQLLLMQQQLELWQK